MKPDKTIFTVIETNPPKLYEEIEHQMCPDCGKPYGIDQDSCSCPLEFEIWE